MKSFKNMLLAGFFLLVGVTGFGLAASSPSVQAANRDELCSGANLDITGNTKACNKAGEPEAGDKLNTIISTVVNILSIIVGVAAVIMIIWGGFRYVTSGGDSGAVGNAKNTIIYALVGLVIVALAQFIVKFVLSKLA